MVSSFIDSKITSGMPNFMIPEIDIKSKLHEIESKGFIKSLRKSDTGIGFTLETEMGIKENNLKNEDFTYEGELVELKTQRKDTTSNITLFTREPEKGDINDKKLMEKYGYVDKKARPALKITVTTRNYTPQNLNLKVDLVARKISLNHRIDDLLWTWSIDDLKMKIQNLLLVFAERKRDQGVEFFHYNEAYYFTKFKDDVFLKLMERGRIVVDLRMHLKQTGKVRNHGTAFRIIDLKDLVSCYGNIEPILKTESSFL